LVFFASGFCPGAGLYFDLFLNKILFILRKPTPSFLPVEFKFRGGTVSKRTNEVHQRRQKENRRGER